MSCRFVLLATAFAGCLTASGAAIAENRLALVIGNSAYQSAPALPNPVNDAKAVTELLQSAGFEVLPGSDLTQSDMRRSIGDFADKVASKGPDTVAVVYYAGHGLQVGGENYLVPVDANIKSEAEVALNAIRFDDLMNALEAVPTKARIVILDACRNNPFAEVKKTVGRGLAMVNAPVGSVVAYSTSPGTEAEDGQGANSPFTAAFVLAAKQPGVPVEQAFKNVRLSVHNATEGRQTPWEVLSLTSNFSFFPQGAEPAPVTAKADPDRTSDKPATRSAYWKKQLRAVSAKDAYNLVVKEDSVDAYREFLALYPAEPLGQRVRAIVNRRQEMTAWYTAVTANSVASYKYFLAKYGTTDMAGMARGLMARASTRALLASNDPAALGLQVASVCNCSTPPTRRAENKKSEKKSKQTRSAYREVPAEPVAVQSDPPIAISIGGIGGIGRFGGGRRYEGGRHGGGSMSGSHMPNRSYRR